MIPRKIHYCWFGNAALPDDYQAYVDQWHALHPGWEIIKWDEKDLPDHPYIDKALSLNNWANLSNYIRLYALQLQGGIYLDVDMKLLQPLDGLLQHACFLGFESGSEAEKEFWVNNAIMGAVAEHPFVIECEQELLKRFDGAEEANLSSPHLMTNLLRDHHGLNSYGRQVIDGIQLYEKEVFYPIHCQYAYKVRTQTEFPNETIAVHTWGRTWLKNESLVPIIDQLQRAHDLEQQEKIRLQHKLCAFEVQQQNIEEVNARMTDVLTRFSGLEQAVENLTQLLPRQIEVYNHEIKTRNQQIEELKKQLSYYDRPDLDERGKNLTIAFTSGASLEAITELLFSIEYYLPAFEGSIIVSDNLLGRPEKKQLRDFASTLSYDTRIVDIPAAATGLNRVVSELAATEWVWVLREDLRLTADILPPIKQAVEFLSLACLSFISDEEEMGLNAGLTNYLLPGSFLVNRSIFNAVGGLDAELGEGMMEMDFSIRLNKLNLKIGALESGNLIKKAKTQRHGDTAARKLVGRKRVALVVDVRDWAFHNIAKNIERYLGHQYEFTIYFQEDYAAEKWLELYPLLCQEKHDLVFFFWRYTLKHLFSVQLRDHLVWNCGILPEEFAQYLNDTVLLTAVYDHMHSSPQALLENTDIFSNDIDGYVVSSEKLNEIYSQVPDYRQPYGVIQDGVDLERFFKKPYKHFSSPSEPLVVGWAGNSAWGMANDGIDHKGFNTIIKPAIDELISEGHAVKLIYADKQEPATHIAPAKMNDFYDQLDVYICASDIEGTPNPVLESMAAGIAVISTDVGIVREVLGKQQKDFIMEKRTKDCLKAKLKKLIHNRELLTALAEENHIRIEAWTWESKCRRFDELFAFYLDQKTEGKLETKAFPFMPSLQISVQEEETIEATPVVDLTNYVPKDDFMQVQEQSEYWKGSSAELKQWYHKEYDVLPRWFKRLGHIVKVFQGHRSFKSLFR